MSHADEHDMLLHRLLPKSQVWESWVTVKFKEYTRRLCSVSITGLPKGFRWDYGRVKKWVLTLRGTCLWVTEAS